MPGIGAFISAGWSLDRTLDRVRRADELGFDSVYTTHIAGRDSLSLLMAYASVSERARLGTGVVPIFSRTPVTMAQTAATIDEFSGGRMVLGLGVSHKVTVENWYGARIEKPVTQMREYAGIVRAILRGETPPEGKFFNTAFQFMGYEGRAELPIHVAALSPNMLRLAGEIAAFDEGMQAGDLERAKSGLSDWVLGARAGIGSADEVRAAVERYRDAGTTSPCIGGIPGTDFDGALDAV